MSVFQSIDSFSERKLLNLDETWCLIFFKRYAMFTRNFTGFLQYSHKYNCAITLDSELLQNQNDYFSDGSPTLEFTEPCQIQSLFFEFPTFIFRISGKNFFQ
jgi:hypothetical protein